MHETDIGMQFTVVPLPHITSEKLVLRSFLICGAWQRSPLQAVDLFALRTLPPPTELAVWKIIWCLVAASQRQGQAALARR